MIHRSQQPPGYPLGLEEKPVNILGIQHVLVLSLNFRGSSSQRVASQGTAMSLVSSRLSPEAHVNIIEDFLWWTLFPKLCERIEGKEATSIPQV